MPQNKLTSRAIYKPAQEPATIAVFSEQLMQTSEQQYGFAVPDGSTDLEFLIGILSSELKMIYMFSTQPVHVKTNNSTSPNQEFDISFTSALAWHIESELQPVPFSSDIDSLYITNASGADAIVRIFTLEASTAFGDDLNSLSIEGLDLLTIEELDVMPVQII